MPGNLQALVLLLLFIVPGFVFVEVDARRRPAPKRGTFDKTVLSVLFSTILHVVLLWLVFLVVYLAFAVELGEVFDSSEMLNWTQEHFFGAYSILSFYFLLSVSIAVGCGWAINKITRHWTPVLSDIVRRDQANAVLVQMKNGDFYTGILGVIPADYEILQSPTKDFTIRPPGRYKPKGREWQQLQKTETVFLNTSNVDAIRLMPQELV